jgi:HSP20 family molecular chaperone IbpA
MAMRSSNSWMWAEACEMLERAQRLQRQFFGLGRAMAAQPCWEPPVDVVSCGQELHITVALPGVRLECIAVRMEGSGLLVDAARGAPFDGGTTAIHRLEIPYGRFQRQIILPAGRWTVLEQRFFAGCLQLRLARQ